MDFLDVVKDFALQLAAILLPIFFGYLVRLLVAFLEQKKQEIRLSSLKELIGITEKVVTGIYQNTIQDLKKEGKFNKEVAEVMKKQAIKQIKKELKLNNRKLFKAILKDFKVDSYIGNLVESVIYHKKRGVSIGNIELPISKKEVTGIEFKYKF